MTLLIVAITISTNCCKCPEVSPNIIAKKV